MLGEGFTPRVVDALLTVLAEDTRFRNLPVVVTDSPSTPMHDLPNLELVSGDAGLVASNAMPLIRQHAFEARLGRILKSIDAGGLLDPRTDLLTEDAFNRDFATAIYEALSRGGGLSVARFSFDRIHERTLLDAGRILSRLMRRMDFGVLQNDGSIIVVFAETELSKAHMIARRLSSVLKHTLRGIKTGARLDPDVSLEPLLPSDSAQSVLARLSERQRRAAS